MKLPLKQLISEFISSADLSEHHFMRLWNIGVRGAREFNMDICGNFKTVLLNVNANKTVDFPKDLLTFSKLGILNEFGEIVPLTVNDNMSTLHSQYLAAQGKVVDVPTLNSLINFSSPTQFPFFWFNYYDGAYGGYHLYGLAGGTPVIGQYTINENDKTIYLSDDWPYESVLMEYLADGFDCDAEDYMIDSKASEAMLAFIRWNNAKDNRKKFGAGEVNMFMRDYYRERKLAKRRLNSVDITQMQQVFRSHVKLVAKA